MNKFPEHAENIVQHRQATAPYNFVPLPQEIRYAADPPKPGAYDPQLLTGTVHCVLRNETPIYVRAGQTPNEYAKNQVSSEFFHHGLPEEELLIPGSSIRGMIRTLVEVVSFSRMGSISDMQLFYRSVEETSMGRHYRERMNSKVRAGFYHVDKSGSWIEPAIAGRVLRDDIRREYNILNIYEEVDENGRNILPASPKRVPKKIIQHQTVYIRLNSAALSDPKGFYLVEAFSRRKDTNLQEALLVVTGDMKSRPENAEKKEFVFIKQNNGVQIELSDSQVELFEHKDQITQYQEYAFPMGNGRPGKGKLKNGEPVFYLVDEEDETKIVGFGRAYMFRLPYTKAPVDMFPEGYDAQPGSYDLAETMFGYVPQTRQGRQQVAGRLRFTDAVLVGSGKDALVSSEPLTLRILSGPKATAFQHYLTQNNPDDNAKLSHYDSRTSQTTLRGHKLYWHKGPLARSDFEADSAHVAQYRSQYSPPVKPVCEHQQFTFDIHFENLRSEELGALLWVMDKARDPQYRLKLGMGKSYGLGSVGIDWTITLEDRKQRYLNLFNQAQNQWAIPQDLNQASQLDKARKDFAVWLLKKTDASTDQVDALRQIQELLVMLSWENFPEKAKTRYMQLEMFSGKMDVRTGERGRFSKRPVLPAAHDVFGRWLRYPPAELPHVKIEQEQPPNVVKGRPLKEEKPIPATCMPAHLKPGDTLEADVVDAPVAGDVFLHCKHHDDDDFCVIQAENRSKIDRFKKGKMVLLRVIDLRQDSGGWLIDCEKIV